MRLVDGRKCRSGIAMKLDDFGSILNISLSSTVVVVKCNSAVPVSILRGTTACLLEKRETRLNDRRAHQSLYKHSASCDAPAHRPSSCRNEHTPLINYQQEKPASPSFTLQPFLPQWHHNLPSKKCLNPQSLLPFLLSPQPLSPTTITTVSTLATTPQSLAKTAPDD